MLSKKTISILDAFTFRNNMQHNLLITSQTIARDVINRIILV